MFPTTIRLLSRAIALLVLLAAPAAPALGQAAGSITGQVIDATTSRPLVGAQIYIPGTGIGGLSNAEGRYLLTNVPPGEHVVRVELLGYGRSDQTLNVAPGQTAQANFDLRRSAIELGEIVVTGAGEATERRRIGNVIETVNTADLLVAPVRTVSEVLQARTPGVVVLPSGGMAGEGSRIRVRGSSSLSQKNDPVIYVDGVRIDNGMGYGTDNNASRLDDINPEAIERIEILKGAAAATLYGTEASNGVIQIFTKRGQSGAPRWGLSLEAGISEPYRSRIPKLAGFALRETATAGRDRGTQGIRDYWGISVQPYEVFEVDLTPFILERGVNTDVSLSADGGTDVLRYFVVGRRAWEDGIHGGEQYGPYRDISAFTQVDGSLSILPTPNLRIDLSTRYLDRRHSPTHDGTPSSAISITMLARPMLAHEGNPVGWASFGTVREAMQIMRREDTKRYGGSLTAGYSLTQNLNFDLTTGVDVLSAVGSEFRPFGWNVDGVAGDYPTGYREVQTREHEEFTVDAKANWSAQLTSRFSSSLVVGTQTLIANTQRVTARGQNFPGPGLEVVGAGAVQTNTENILKTVNTGAFVQEQIGFNDYVFVTGGLRVDRHSAFGEDAGFAVYPKLSFSFVPSDMPGWSGSTLSTLRFRAALGQSGLQPGAFDQFTTFRPLGSALGPGLEPDNLGNPELKPEVSTELEGGFDAGFLDDRFSFEATAWTRTVSDLLVQRQFPPSGGFTNPQLDNIGEMTGWGVDMGVNGLLYQGARLTVEAFANGSFLREEVTDLGGAPPVGSGGRRLDWIREGYAPGALFGGKLVDTEYPFDTNRDGQPDTREQLLAYFGNPRTPEQVESLTMGELADDGTLLGHYLGKAMPDWSGAFGLNVSWADFALGSQFQYSARNFHITDHTTAFRNTNASIGRNKKESATADATLLNPASTSEQRLEAARWFAENGFGLGRFNGLNQVVPADYLRWRELTLTWQVPVGLVRGIGADGLTLTAAGRNLMLWTKYPGVDPEVTVDANRNLVTGHSAHKVGVPRRFTLSARLNF